MERQCPFCLVMIPAQATLCPKCRHDVHQHDALHRKEIPDYKLLVYILAGLLAVALWVWGTFGTNATN